MVKKLSTDGYADVLIGLQHGDEGKGRFVDGIAQNYDGFVRYNGGANAGHTVEVNHHTIALHQIPSGVHHPKKKLYIGPHCVVNLEKLCAEICDVERAGLSVLPRLRISSMASVIQPGHIVRDRCTMGSVGTTGNGIGAAYADQSLRVDGNRELDVRLGELLIDTEIAFQMIQANLQMELERNNIKDYDVAGEMNRLRVSFEKVRRCIDWDPLFLLKEIRSGMRLLLEGAQAWGLDKTFGTKPYVTSSNTGVQAAFLSTNIPVEFKRHAYGVAKLIPSRVGHGPFASEFGGALSERHCMEDGGKKHTKEFEKNLFGERINYLLKTGDPFAVGIALRLLGNEYGASTGRPRRLGALDLVQLKYAVDSNGIDSVFLSKADCLRDFSRTKEPGIPVVTDYETNAGILPYMPTTKEELRWVRTHQELHPAFTADIANAREERDLPPQLHEFLGALQNRIGADIRAVGVGPAREQVVHLNGFK